MSRRLYRARHDRILGGVAAGVAQYFRIDPTIVRLAWLLIVLWGGAGIFLYVIAWIIVTLAPNGHSYTAAASEAARGGDVGGKRRFSTGERDQNAIGWLLIGAGIVIVLFGTNIIGWLINPVVMLAVLLVVAGLFFLGRNERPPRVR